MNRFGLFVNNWIFGNVAIEEVISRVSRIGFDGIELVGEPDLYDGEQIRKLTMDFGLKVQSICGMHPGPEDGDLRALGHPQESERLLAIDYVKRCVDLAVEVGARSVLVVPSLVGQPECFVSKSDDLSRATESLVTAAEYAEEHNIILTIEPINRYEVGLIHTLSDAIDLANRIGHSCVRIMGDTFHMQLEERDGIPGAVRSAGQHWLQHLHVADNTREAPGKGTMPWRDILRALFDIDYQGGISFEPLPRGSSPYDARMNLIPPEVLDSQLAFGREYLQREQEVILESR